MNSCLKILVYGILVYCLIAGAVLMCTISQECPKIYPYFDYSEIRLNPIFHEHSNTWRLYIEVHLDSVEYMAYKDRQFNIKNIAALSCVEQTDMPAKFRIKDIDVICDREYNKALNITHQLDEIVKLNKGKFLSEIDSFPIFKTKKSFLLLDIMHEPEDKDQPLDIEVRITKQNDEVAFSKVEKIVWSKIDSNFQ